MAMMMAAPVIALAGDRMPAYPNKLQPVKDRQAYSVYVDKDGTLRRSDTGEEVSYYGTNYTLPFAHGYRAAGQLGIDRKEAIRRDVYHMARLGMNAFRMHLWDAELADAEGNLLENDHLELLDYLIYELELRGIDVVLTAQTNFGNGYPEKNIDTGAFTYDFPKCGIHEDPRAQKIQANYLTQLAGHVNPYTGLSYSKDRGIIAMEINNEPCHEGATAAQVTAYINRMADALKKGGFDKPILYNVSHNGDVVQGYYDADIQGTTYQWYPTNLVSGRERMGNYLYNVLEYPIPWRDTARGFKDKALFVYEFDPGDVLASNLYPAMAKAFRDAGFSWATQFAYDATDMGQYNTEYQTHYLNLAYTPAKAVSMLIAAEAMKQLPRGGEPGDKRELRDTGFDFGEGFRVTDRGSGYMDSTRCYSTDPTVFLFTDIPHTVEHIAAVRSVGGHSGPRVEYDGFGAYFLDKLDDGHWRLEVMPDVFYTEDPFAKPALNREAAQIYYNERPMTIQLPGLSPTFTLTPLAGDGKEARALDSEVTVYPGVYILSDGAPEPGKWTADTPFGSTSAAAPKGNMRLGEYVAPAPSKHQGPLLRNITQEVQDNRSISIVAQVGSTVPVDSVMVYPQDISFWNDHNTLYKMDRIPFYDFNYAVSIPDIRDTGEYSYRLVTWSDGKATTWPGAIPGTPLDWDFPDNAGAYTLYLSAPGEALTLAMPELKGDYVEGGSIPDGQGAWIREIAATPTSPAMYRVAFTPTQNDAVALVEAHLDNVRLGSEEERDELVLLLADKPEGIDNLKMGVSLSLHPDRLMQSIPATALKQRPDGMYEARVKLSDLLGKADKGYTLPAQYPSFMAREYRYKPSGHENLDNVQGYQIDDVYLYLEGLRQGRPVRLDIRALLLE